MVELETVVESVTPEIEPETKIVRVEVDVVVGRSTVDKSGGNAPKHFLQADIDNERKIPPQAIHFLKFVFM